VFNIVKTHPEGPYCDNCTYQPTGVRRVLPTGSGRNGIAFVGDSPWTEEVVAGVPFVGASGRWLDGLLSKRGLSRDDFWILNAGTWCKPPLLGMNDEPEKYESTERAMHQCRPYLDGFMSEYKPKVLIPLGNVALRSLTGFTDIERNHAYIFKTSYDIPAVPSFHPSGIIQGHWNLTLAFVLAVARALELATGSYQPTECKITEDPSPDYLKYPGNGDLPMPLMTDIETPDSLHKNEEESEDDPSYKIIRMGFSISPWQGVSFPFDGDYISRAKALVKRARVLIFWNKNYDLPRLKASGFELHPDVQIVDAMWAFHFLYSDMPKSLAYAAPFFYNGEAWKHLGNQRPAYYNGMDNACQMGVYQGIKSTLEREGRWDRFWNHCVRIDPIYVRMGAAGVKVDKPAREIFMNALAEDAHAELLKVQELLPPNLWYENKIEFLHKEPKPKKTDPTKVKPLKAKFNSLIWVEKIEVPAKHKDGTSVFDSKGDFVMKPEWHRHNPFNPNSTYHKLELMKALKVKIPRARGEDRESTEAKYLKRFTKYPIFRHSINYTQRSKLIGTYNWPLDEQDRAHTTYGYHPSTLRSSSRRVNLGNIPKRYHLAELFRRLIIAESGHKFIEIDRSAIEAVLVGYWAKSEAYIKLAKAGVHSYLCAYYLHSIGKSDLPDINWSFNDLKAFLKGIKKMVSIEVYEGMKRVIHGSNYLLSAFGIHDEYEEYFPTEYSAQSAQDMYFNSPAGHDVRRYHKETIEEAYAHKYLDNSFQYRHYFYGPMYKLNKRTGKWEVDHEGDAKRAVAYRPQSDAAAIQREDILAMEPYTDYSKFLRLPTYDSLILEAPDKLVDKGIEMLYNQFCKPIRELGDLTIGFEVKVGSNLAPKKDDNPGGMEEVAI